ncbi:hypothetical protein E2L08_01370 [Palleronia sediminis]|uniref:Uncharacterized protein n=1 Tax=Palleronia sediminis TaxID=2547833 RepID=A0A4R6AKL6_9RHOB|nr:hypothetical protein [Palleronia sediminis]TDL84147.1 hypothetical protein E2L08_01370 [Palleronia sediminis]
MNLGQIGTMAVRMILRRLMSRGMNAGINRAFGAARTPGAAKQGRAAQVSGKRTKQAMRVARRFGRF